DGDEVIVAPTGDRYAYSKLLIAGGELVGGLVLGRPADSPRLISAVKRRMHVGDRLDALRAGDSSALDATAPVRAGRQEARATP
ncbi:MAG: hypothetical protein ACRDUA_22810, partial [Micromonosporaceae bacterium]